MPSGKRKVCEWNRPEAEVGFQPTRTSKLFTRLHRNTVVWKVYAAFGWKAPHSRPESNKSPISENPLRIPPLFSHYPVTIWRRRSESNRFRRDFDIKIADYTS